MYNITLPKLKKLIDTNPTIFTNEQHNAINYYYGLSKQEWCLGHFYLGDQLKLPIDSEITTNHIQKVIDINKEKQSMSNCHSIEFYRFQTAISKFNEFVSVFNRVISEEIELN